MSDTETRKLYDTLGDIVEGLILSKYYFAFHHYIPTCENALDVQVPTLEEALGIHAISEMTFPQTTVFKYKKNDFENANKQISGTLSFDLFLNDIPFKIRLYAFDYKPLPETIYEGTDANT